MLFIWPRRFCLVASLPSAILFWGGIFLKHFFPLNSTSFVNYSELILNFCVRCVTTPPFCRCSSKLFLYLRQVRHRPRAERGRIRTHHPKLGRPFLEDILEHHRDRSPVSKWAVNVSHIHARTSGTDPRRRTCIGAALSLILKPRRGHFFIKFPWLCILAYRPQVIMEWNSISSALWFIHLVSSSLQWPGWLYNLLSSFSLSIHSVSLSLFLHTSSSLRVSPVWHPLQWRWTGLSPCPPYPLTSLWQPTTEPPSP